MQLVNIFFTPASMVVSEAYFQFVAVSNPVNEAQQFDLKFSVIVS